MEERPFTLTRPDGELIRGEVRIPSDGEHPNPEGVPNTAVVILHGFKGFRRWGFFPHLARSLAAAGHAVITFDFSLNGVGAGGRDFDELEAFARNTFTRELDEVAQVVEALEGGDLPAPVPDRIGLLGHSRGGGTAILAAAELESSVDALVSWAAVATFDRWGEEVKNEWRERGRIHIPNARTGQDMPLDIGLLEDLERNRDRLDILAAAGRVAAPWCIIHGTDDESVSAEDAEQLHAAAPGAELELISGAGHTFGATHPFQDQPAHLAAAIGRTRAHFEQALTVGASSRPTGSSPSGRPGRTSQGPLRSASSSTDSKAREARSDADEV